MACRRSDDTPLPAPAPTFDKWKKRRKKRKIILDKTSEMWTTSNGLLFCARHECIYQSTEQHNDIWNIDRWYCVPQVIRQTTKTGWILYDVVVGEISEEHICYARKSIKLHWVLTYCISFNNMYMLWYQIYKVKAYWPIIHEFYHIVTRRQMW